MLSLRIAAAASMVFWLGLFAFTSVEFVFDDARAARWWLEPLDNALIFTVWMAACVATVSAILAMRAEWRRLRFGKRVEPARQPLASPGEGKPCAL